MLKNLKISNIKLIEDVDISFEAGLNIISGETGAGKSIILNSLNLILGEQARSDLIRSGAAKARIEAIFDISGYEDLITYLRDEAGIPCEENLLLITREIDEKGSNVFVNQSRVLIQTLKQIGSFLVDLHGQNQHQSLFDRNNHLRLLDRYAGLEEDLRSYRQEFQKALQLNKELKELKNMESQKERLIQFNEFALNEIRSVKLKVGEYEELEEEQKRLLHYQEIYEVVAQAYYLFYGSEQSALSALQKTGDLLEKIQDKEKDALRALPFLKQALISLEPVKDFLRAAHDRSDFSPERLEAVSRRLEIYRALQNKYDKNVSELIDYSLHLEAELEKVEQSQGAIEELEKKIDLLREKLSKMALGLSAKRRAAARKMEKAIETELAFLSMPRARVEVLFEHLEDPEGKILLEDGKRVKLSRDGIERLEFMLSPNLGEKPKPLMKIASGGELSRIMLSIKNILRKIDPIITLVFDEIDAGIGGETAFAVGKKLKEISKDKQVLCITHLAQIASMGDFQFKVDKMEEEGRTKTIIAKLTQEERIKEISRMLSGENLTDTSLEHAREFLKSNA